MPLSEEEVREAREAFTLFDRESTGRIMTSEIITVLRSLGHTPPAAVIADMQRDADSQLTGYVKIGDFLRQVERAVELAKATNQDSAKQLPWLSDSVRYLFEGQSAKKVREEPDEFISVPGLKRVLCSIGEKLSDEEARELVRELQIHPGNKIKMAELVTLLTSI